MLPRRLRILVAIEAAASLSLVAACRQPSPAPTSSRPSEPTSAAQTPSASSAPAAAAESPASSLTGPLDEAAFKKLHELKTEAAPPPRGEHIDVAGTKSYLSLPPGGKPPLPGIVVIHEWWGLNEHVMHWADRLAQDGYAALAVDLYEGKVAKTPDEAMAYVKTVDGKKAIATLVAGHDFLRSDARVRASRIGVIGWCFGGNWSLELGLAAPDVDAVVVYYGHVTTDPARLAKLHAPLLGIFANRDQSIPPPYVDDFEKALKKVGAKYEIYRYEADHAFANPSGARYDQKSAEDAWKHARAFLSAHLKTPK